MESTTRLATPPAAPRPPVGLGAAMGPGAGVLSIPPASVPLSFLATAGAGLVAFGLAVAVVADDVTVAPTHPHVTATAHVAMLAFLTMAVAGALHQFGPVVGQRRLRSIAVARLSWIGLAVTTTLLPLGFARGEEDLIPVGGLIGAATVSLIVWNLSGPLGRQASGVPVWGLRLSVTLLLATVGFGVTYAFNRQTGWFPLYPHRLLAHVHLGLFGWLGVTYAAVAEKLWPMFLLAHRPRARSGAVAVAGMASGTAILATGLVFDLRALIVIGAIGIAIGIAGHVTSLCGAVRHRRRRLELLHVALFVSAAFLLVAVACALIAGIADVRPVVRSRLVTAEVAALVGWLGVAIVGHVHKIVPFIGFTSLRERGVARGPDGGPLLFSHLFDHRVATATVALASVGFGAIVVGVLVVAPELVRIGGVALVVAAVATVGNLASGPLRVRRASVTKEEP